MLASKPQPNVLVHRAKPSAVGGTVHTGHELLVTCHFQRMWDLITGRKGAHFKLNLVSEPVLGLLATHSSIPGSSRTRGNCPCPYKQRRWLPAAHTSSKSRATSGGLWESHIPWTIWHGMILGIITTSQLWHASLLTELSDTCFFGTVRGCLLNDTAARHFQTCDNSGNCKEINCLLAG